MIYLPWDHKLADAWDSDPELNLSVWLSRNHAIVVRDPADVETSGWHLAFDDEADVIVFKLKYKI